MEMIVGFLGVIVGAVIPLFYMYEAESRALKNDYKKLCVSEWSFFITQVSDLMSNPKGYNHIIFNQYIDQKAQLIKYIEKYNSEKEKIDILIKEIDKQKDALSLGDYAEKALNKPESDQEKEMLMREVSIMAHKIIGEIYKI